MEKITFVTDDGGKEEFYVEEQTRMTESTIFWYPIQRTMRQMPIF